MKTKIKISSLLTILLTLFICVGCVKEDIYSVREYSGSTFDLPIGFTRSPSGFEIKRYRILVFSDGALVSNTELTNTQDDTPTTKVKVAKGINNFYVFCNETAELKTKIDNITSESELENITFTSPAAGTNTDVPMYGKVLNALVEVYTSGANITIGGETKTHLTVNVDRLMAKISLTVIKNTAAESQKFTIKSMSYRICRIPKTITIAPNAFYTLTEYQDNLSNEGVGSILTDGAYNTTTNPYTVASGDYITFPSVSVPEHILTNRTDPNKCTYMVITANLVLEGSGVEMSSVYTLNLGHLPPANLNLVRNNHYHIFATVKSIGSMGFYAEIVPLVEYNTPITWTSFEGYTIVSERAESYGIDEKIFSDYFQYYGILKVTRKNMSTNKSTIYPALFRYGSVVALTQRNLATVFNTSLFNPATNTTGDILYYPLATTAPTNWTSIGYLDSGDDMELEHTLPNIQQGKGDPCRLIGLSNADILNNITDNNLWRMATEEQMRWLIAAQNPNVSTSSKGFHSLGVEFITPNTLGKRSDVDGIMVLADNAGSYWSSTTGKLFSFNSLDQIGTIVSGNTAEAHSVRCIRTDIPPSRFGVHYAATSYAGGSFDWKNLFPPIDVVYNTSYWRITGWDNSDGMTFTKTSGYYKNPTDYEVPHVVIPRSPDAYVTKIYTVDFEGYGLDGKLHKVKSYVHQEKLTHDYTLYRSNSTGRISADGETIRFSFSVRPLPIEKHAVGGSEPFADMEWYMKATYVAPSGTYIFTSPAVLTSQSTEITIPANTSAEEIGVIFSFHFIGPPIGVIDNSPNSNGSFYYVQNKK